MSRIRYTKYTPAPLETLDLESLMEELKEFFLESGFYSQFYPSQTSGQTFGSLRRALAEILSKQESLPQEWRDALKEYADDGSDAQLPGEVDEFLNQVIEKLMDQGYLRQSEESGVASETGTGETAYPADHVEFELTGKASDLLGYKTLREILSSLGKSSFGRHATRELATGVESDAHSREYEFGDTLNLDTTTTLLNVFQRDGLSFPLQLEYQDLMVYQTEYQSSCATVIMLDCSHSMILYGEDRFTPAKKIALALAHLIRTQFPGDTLHVVLFHDSAEQIPLQRLASVKIGPYHTNTYQGLQLARRILLNQKKDMRQIVMITDGKPSAVTLPDGRIYRNSMGLDPLILQKTYREVANCRRSGILINTFMLARDPLLVNFVKKVSQICRGTAYFTTTFNLASYILMDFMKNKTKQYVS